MASFYICACSSLTIASLAPGRAELHFNFSEDQNAVEEGTQIAYLRILKGWGENLEMIKSTTQRPPISISVRHPN